MADQQTVGIEFVAQDLERFLSGVGNVDTSMQRMNQAVEASVKDLTALERAVQQTKIDKLSGDIDLQKKKLEILNQELEKTKAKYGEGSTQAQRAQLAIDTLNHSISQNEKKLEGANTALADLDRKQEAAAQSAQQITTATPPAAQAVEKLGNEAESAGPKFSAMREIATGALREIGALAIEAGIAFAGMAVDFGAESINIAADYESTLNRFSAVTGESITRAGYDIEQFNTLFLKLGADTEFSSQQAADAAVMLAKGGVDIPLIMGGALDATLALAAAGELELAPAADIVAKQLGVWADEGVTAAEVADYLAQASNASTVDVEELADGLSNAGGTAKTAGVDFGDLVTAMALIAPGFSSSTEAGTSLRNFLVRLQPTTASATAAMEDLGLWTEETGSVFYDAQGNFIGMEAASEELRKATEGLTEADKLLYMQTIFGNDAMNAAAILSEQGGEGYRQMASDMEAAGGAAKQAEARQQGFNFAMEQLKGSLETLQIVLGGLVLPTLTRFIENVVIPGANAVLNLAMAISDAGLGSAEASEAFGYLTSTLAGLFGGSFDFAGFSTSFSSLGDTIGTAIANAVPVVITSLGNLAMSMLTWVGEAMPQFLEGYGQFIRSMGNKVLEAMPDILSSLGEVAKSLINWVMTTAPEWGEALVQYSLEMVEWVADALPGLADNLGIFFNDMVNWVVDNLPTWIERLAEFGAKAISWIIDAIPGLSANLVEFAAVILGWLAQTILDVAPKLLEMANTFLTWVVNDVIPTLPSELAKIWESISTWFAETTPKAIAKLVELGAEFWEWVTADGGPIEKIGGELLKLQNTILSAIGDMAAAALEAAWDIGAGIWDGIVQGLGNLVQKMKDAMIGPLAEGLQDVKDFFGISSPSDVTDEEIGAPIAQGIMRGLSAGLQAFGTVMIDILGAAILMVSEIAKTGGGTIGTDFSESLLVTLDTLKQNLSKTMENLAVESTDAMKGKIKEAAPAVANQATAIADAISETAPDFADAGATVGDMMIDEIVAVEDAARNTMLDITDVIDTSISPVARAAQAFGQSATSALLGQLGMAQSGAAGVFGAIISSAAAAAAQAGSIIGSIGAGGTVSAPSVTVGAAGAGGGSTTNNYNYAPVYQGAPPQPSQDFAIMTTFAHAGG